LLAELQALERFSRQRFRLVDLGLFVAWTTQAPIAHGFVETSGNAVGCVFYLTNLAVSKIIELPLVFVLAPDNFGVWIP
jgi:hypothetical protein